MHFNNKRHLGTAKYQLPTIPCDDAYGITYVSISV